jgi:hypothetical protein
MSRVIQLSIPSEPVQGATAKSRMMNWAIAIVLASITTPFIVAFKDSAPWIIYLFLGIAAVLMLFLELTIQGFIRFHRASDFESVAEGFLPMKDYESSVALAVRPKVEIPKGQLELFPAFPKATPRNAVRVLKDDNGNDIFVVSAERFSALLVSYLLEHADKATERALLVGLQRFARKSINSDLQLFIKDKAIREAIKSDFRGNIVTVMSRGGDKILKDILKEMVLAGQKPENTENQNEPNVLSLEYSKSPPK